MSPFLRKGHPPTLPLLRRRGGRASRRSYRSGTSKRATMLMILINGLMAGPAVSL